MVLISELKKMEKTELIEEILYMKAEIVTLMKDRDCMERKIFKIKHSVKDNIRLVKFIAEEDCKTLKDVFTMVNQDFNWLGGKKIFSYKEFKKNLLRYFDEKDMKGIICRYDKFNGIYTPHFDSPLFALNELCRRKLVKKTKDGYLVAIEGRSSWCIDFLAEIKEREVAA